MMNWPQKANTEGEEVGIEPRRDISFCSFEMGNTDEEGDEDRYVCRYVKTRAVCNDISLQSRYEMFRFAPRREGGL